MQICTVINRNNWEKEKIYYMDLHTHTYCALMQFTGPTLQAFEEQGRFITMPYTWALRDVV